ncbi:TPA: hypothetical protein ACTN8T_001871, partial [Campylobacter jejuni]
KFIEHGKTSEVEKNLEKDVNSLLTKVLKFYH